MKDRLTTEQYLRWCIKDFIHPYVSKDKCEVCGETENLALHHKDKTFVEMMVESHNILKLDIKNYFDEYESKDFRALKLLVFGMHIENLFVTLCKNCHIVVHKENTKPIHAKSYVKKYKKQIAFMRENFGIEDPIQVRLLYNQYFLPMFLKDYENRMLIGDEIKNFREELTGTLLPISTINARKGGLQILNAVLNFYNTGYIIKSGRLTRKPHRGKGYWKIEKIEGFYSHEK